MLKIVDTVVTKDEYATITEHAVEGTVELAGDSAYNYEGSNTVAVSKVVIVEELDGEISAVNVVHNTTWNIYTDTGFERAIGELLGFDVMFTEEGMQNDEFASMELG